jgi:hypothetical protein
MCCRGVALLFPPRPLPPTLKLRVWSLSASRPPSGARDVKGLSLPSAAAAVAAPQLIQRIRTALRRPLQGPQQRPELTRQRSYISAMLRLHHRDSQQVSQHCQSTRSSRMLPFEGGGKTRAAGLRRFLRQFDNRSTPTRIMALPNRRTHRTLLPTPARSRMLYHPPADTDIHGLIVGASEWTIDFPEVETDHRPSGASLFFVPLRAC